MSTYRTYFRSGSSYHDMTAVAAFPYLYFTPGKYLLCLNIVKQCAIALLMMLLYSSNTAELGSKLREAFLLCCLGKACVHVCPLIVLTVSCSGKILGCSSDTVELLEPQFSVFLLVVGCLLKESCYLLKAVLFSLLCKI